MSDFTVGTIGFVIGFIIAMAIIVNACSNWVS